MGSLIDLTGKHFGMLVVLERDQSSKTASPKWICKCQCGNIKSISSQALRTGRTKSCGCQANKGKKGINKTHGMSKTRIYHEWSSMRRRCKPNSNDSKTYYDRGITVCNEWQTDFMSFYKWAMASGYNDSLSIDRIDNDLGYSPDNCRWIDIRLQQEHKSNTVKISYNGQEYCLRRLCLELNFPYKVAHARYMRLKRENKPISTDFIFAPREKHKSKNLVLHS